MDSVFIPPRRNHTAVKINKFMIINGGLDQQDKPMQDTWAFNLEVLKWQLLYVEKPIPALSHHRAAAVFKSPQKIHDLYSRNNLSPPYQEPEVSILSNSR